MRNDNLRTADLAFVAVTIAWAGGCGSSEGPGQDAAPPRESVVQCVPGWCKNLTCTNGETIITRWCDPPPPPPPPPSSEYCLPFVSWIPEKMRCDDGNTYGGDCCSALCQLEANCVCDDPRHGPGCINISVCGDGLPTTNEICDDGVGRSGDGCSEWCDGIEPGWVCPVPGKPCTPICGDGILLGKEECDDGNTDSGDGCSRYCRLEPGASCPEVGKPCAMAGCGSPGVDGGACDAGPAIGTTCGDGILSPDEECDRGSDNDDLVYGGCTTACKLGPHCGDGIVNGPAETCDLGPAATAMVWSLRDEGSCTATCLATPYCGDGVVDARFDEECDLGVAHNGAQGSPCDRACHVIPGWSGM